MTTKAQLSQQACANGIEYIKRGDFLAASIYFGAALSLDSHNMDAVINLSASLEAQGRYKEALPHALNAVDKAPNHLTWGNLGIILFRLGDFAGAEKAYLACLKANPRNAVMQYNLAFAQLSLGKYQEGWQQVEWRKQTSNWKGREPFPGLPTWKGVVDKSILLFTEQGYGDSLMLSRYIPYVQKLSSYCAICCPYELARLFHDSFGIDIIDSDSIPKINHEQFDYQCSLYDLPHIFNITTDNIPKNPYLTANSSLVDKWRHKKHPNKINIGLVWAGGVRDNNISRLTDSRRSITLTHFMPLFGEGILNKVNFISLQKGFKATEARQFRFVNDLSQEINDFADTAAIMSSLNLVISVDTSVIHLAGGLGKAVWVLNRYDSCWPWLANPNNLPYRMGPQAIPWYGEDVVEFRQRVSGDWESVIREVAIQLEKAIG